jgi:transmembrane 9 superfamily protein 3
MQCAAISQSIYIIYVSPSCSWYQMYVDELPIWGMVGEIDESTNPPTYKIFTHKKLEIGYNGNQVSIAHYISSQVVDVNLTSDGRVTLTPHATLSFSYEVIWKKSSVKFSDRFDKYLDPTFFQHRIHWFSIFNSL